MNKLHLPSISLILLSIITNIIMIRQNIGHQSTTDLPIILVVSTIITLFGIYSIEIATKLFKRVNLSKLDNFKYDFYIINYSIIFATFLQVFLERNNIDMNSWWPVFAFVNVINGIIFSVIYALIGMIILKQHKLYTIIFSVFLILCLVLARFLKMIELFQLPIINEIPFDSLFMTLIFTHLITCLVYRLCIK